MLFWQQWQIIIEVAELHFMHGLSDGSMREANCLYQEWFPGCMNMERRMFSGIYQHFSQWSIRIEPNRPREAVITEYS
jgi:hypothetical protein